MAYGIYLKLDQSSMFGNNFSATNPLTGTIYTDKLFTTAKDLTGYTVKIMMGIENSNSVRFDKTAFIVTPAAGTWSYPIAQSEMPFPRLYEVYAEISKSGDQETTLNRQQLLISNGPAS